MDYVILPDGTPFRIVIPEDYQEALAIAKDEVGTQPHANDE
jgi:hypothetical protein